MVLDSSKSLPLFGKKTLVFFYFSPLKPIFVELVIWIFDARILKAVMFFLLDDEAKELLTKYVINQKIKQARSNTKQARRQKFSVFFKSDDIKIKDHDLNLVQKKVRVLHKNKFEKFEPTSNFSDLKNSKNFKQTSKINVPKHEVSKIELDIIILDFFITDFKLFKKKISQYKTKCIVANQSWIDTHIDAIQKFQSESSQEIVFESPYSLLDETSEFGDAAILEIENEVSEYLQGIEVSEGLRNSLHVSLSDMRLNLLKEKLVSRHFFKSHSSGKALLLTNSKKFALSCKDLKSNKLIEVVNYFSHKESEQKFPLKKQLKIIDKLAREKIVTEVQQIQSIKSLLTKNEALFVGYIVRENEIDLLKLYQKHVFDKLPGLLSFNEKALMENIDVSNQFSEVVIQPFSEWAIQCQAKVMGLKGIFKSPLRGIDANVSYIFFATLVSFYGGEAFGERKYF